MNNTYYGTLIFELSKPGRKNNTQNSLFDYDLDDYTQKIQAGVSYQMTDLDRFMVAMEWDAQEGENICIGYFKNEEATKAAFTEDGFLKTGDLGVIDAHGNIFIRGRSKSMILSANGQNIYPEEVEAAVNSQDFVAESVVVDRGAKLVALVYLDHDAIRKAGLDEETISDIPERVRVNANRTLPSYSQIQKVEL